MAIFKDSESRQDVFDLIERFDKSSLFELEISTYGPTNDSTKIKMMKLSQDNPGGEAVKVTIEDSDIEKKLELKKDKNVSEGDK